MSFSERIAYGLGGGFVAAAIAMAIMFWTSSEHSNMLFKILIPAGVIGGFLIGKQFYDFLNDLFRRLW